MTCTIIYKPRYLLIKVKNKAKILQTTDEPGDDYDDDDAGPKDRRTRYLLERFQFPRKGKESGELSEGDLQRNRSVITFLEEFEAFLANFTRS